MARDQRAYLLSRRSFCGTLAGLVLIAPNFAVAQGSTRVRRIGSLESGLPDTPEFLWKEAEPLRRLGWLEGHNLLIERRLDNGRFEALQSLAEELVRANVEIIVTGGSPATLAAKNATTTIPIVFKAAGDPVLLGLVTSLARPGGNVTGFSGAGPEVTAKSLSVLKELLPRMQRVGVLWEGGNPYYRAARGQFEHVCHSLGLVPIVVEIDPARDAIGSAIAELARRGAEAMRMEGSFASDHQFEIVDAAMKRGLPTMADYDASVREAGALISFTYSLEEQDRIRAYHIDRILRGAKPADLPVRQPTKFVLIINLKTARALGLTIPKELLLRADEVIE